MGLSIGDDVQAIGHPNEMWWTYTRGYVSQFRNNYEWIYEDESFTLNANVIQTQTPITTGNSGGPLFTKRGEILGLNAFGDPEFQSINFAISFDEIESFLSNLGKNQLLKFHPLHLGGKKIAEKNCRKNSPKSTCRKKIAEQKKSPNIELAGSSETRFDKVSRRSEPCSRANRRRIVDADSPPVHNPPDLTT